MHFSSSSSSFFFKNFGLIFLFLLFFSFMGAMMIYVEAFRDLFPYGGPLSIWV